MDPATPPDFKILGPVEVVRDGRSTHLGGPKLRSLLGALLLHVNEVVSADLLVDLLWGPSAPATARAALRSQVAYLRRALDRIGAGDVLVTQSPGYLVRLPPGQLDARRFERLVGDGETALRAERAEEAAGHLRAALALWRGPLLAGTDVSAFASGEAARLEELRLTAVESRVEADLALGRHATLVGELEQAVRAHPFRERLSGHLMLALYRSGRQAEALEAFRALRTRLSDELGIAPSPALRRLETAILRHDPGLARPEGQTRTGAARASRPAVVQVPSALLDMVQRGPFVARDRDLALLWDRWVAVRAGRRAVVLIDGEAGVGKTRLAAEFASKVGPQAELLVGHCDQASLVAYQPIVEAFRDSPAVAEAVASASAAFRSRLTALLGETAAPSTPAAAQANPEHERLALYEAVVWVLAQLAADRPVVFVVEDLERCDRASAMLLRHLAQSSPGRVLLVLTYRDPPGSRHPPLRDLLVDLERRGGFDRVTLPTFDEAEVAALVAAMTGAEPAEPFVRSLWRHTGGNPFYAAEMVRYLGSGGAGAIEERLGVPAGVRDVLRHRLDGLAEDTRRLLACAAVAGGEVPFALLEAVMEVPDDELLSALDEAIRAGLLVEAGGSWSAAYTFPHALVRDAVYDDLPGTRRQRLHLRVARALQAAGPASTASEEVPAARLSAAAVHLRAAGPLADWEEAVALSVRAAESARDLYAWDEAAAHAQAALALLAGSGGPAGRIASVAELAGTLLWVASVDFRQAVRLFEEALDHYRRVRDERSMARVQGRLGMALATHPAVMDIPRAMDYLAAAESAQPHAVASWHIQNGKAWAAIYGLDTERIGAAVHRALAIAADEGRRDLRAWNLSADAHYRFNRGELAAARELHESAWQTATALGDPHLGWNAARILSFHSAHYLADPRTAQRWCRRGLALRQLDMFPRQRHDLLDLLALASGLRGDLAAAREAAEELGDGAVVRRFLALWDGDWEAAERSWAGALERDTTVGDLLDATLTATWLAFARHLLGRDTEAVAALRQALAWSAGGPQVPAELMVRAELARILPRLGAVEEAAEHLSRCDAILGSGEDWCGRAGHVELARGAVAAARGEAGLAASAYDTAARILAGYDLPWHRAVAMRDWSRWLASAGSTAEAAAVRAGARELCAEIGASERWQRVFLAADDTPGAAKPEPELLTEREREVLRLVAAGLSDREIAERLVLSPHTVHRHMANIRTKLGQPSRAAAVAHATRHHLA